MHCKTFIDIWIPLELAADGFAEPLLSTSELDHQTYSVDRPPQPHPVFVHYFTTFQLSGTIVDPCLHMPGRKIASQLVRRSIGHSLR